MRERQTPIVDLPSLDVCGITMETPQKSSKLEEKTKMSLFSARHKDQFLLTPSLLILTLTTTAWLKLSVSISLSDVHSFFLFSTHCFTFFKIKTEERNYKEEYTQFGPAAHRLGSHAVVDVVAKCSEKISQDARRSNICVPSQIIYYTMLRSFHETA